jgi:cytochrome c oxidase assembly factor 5
MSCEHLVQSLKDCLLFSDCVVKHGNLPSECLKDHFEELPTQCQNLRIAVFECKRAQVGCPGVDLNGVALLKCLSCQLDMRKRFRGVPGRKLPTDAPTIPPLLNRPPEELEK